MANPTRDLAFTLARRVLFIAALLLTGPMSVSAFHYLQKTGATRLPPLAVFTWGLDEIGMVLAIWLVARVGIWRTWSGWLRITCYLLSYAYGRMLFSATQDWMIISDATFRFPGSERNDYARPALDLLSLLMDVWLLAPILILTEFLLAGSGNRTRRTNRFSISGILLFTTTAAIAFAWIKFLTSNLAPQTYYSHLSQSEAIKDWLGNYLPSKIPQVIAAMTIMYGLSKRWWLALLLFLLAISLDSMGTKIVTSSLSSLRASRTTASLPNPIWIVGFMLAADH